jgi:hypothetical protein
MAGKPIGSFYVSLGLNTKEFQRNLKRAERDLYQAFGASAIRTSQIMAASMAAVASSIAAVGAAAVYMAADLERSTVSFTRLLGSADAAEKKLRSLQEFAARTPYTFTELVDYEKRLLALGFSADATRKMLTTIGDTASGLGLDRLGVQRLIKAFGDIQTKGVVATQEMKQFGEVGVNANKILAQALLGSGEKIGELQKLIENRQVSATAAITGMMTGLNAQFGGMMNEQSKTLIGMWSMIRDEGENSLRVIGKIAIETAGLSEWVQKVRDGAVQFRETLEDAGFLAAFDKTFGMAGKVAVVGLTGAIAGMAIPAIIGFGITVKLAGVPLIGLAAAGVVLAGTAVKVYENWVPIKALFDSIGLLGERAVLRIGMAVDELKAKVVGLVQDAQPNAALRKALGAFGGPVGQSVLSALDESDKATAQSYVNTLDSIEDAKRRILAVDNELRKNAGKIEAAMNPVKKAGNIWNYLLPEGVQERARSYGRTISDLWATETGWLKAVQGMGAVSSGSGEKDKGGAKLISDAAKTSDSIYEEYLRTTQGKEALLGYQYQKEKEALEKSKGLNKNYERDKMMLSETFYRKRIDLLQDEQKKTQKIEEEKGKSYAELMTQLADADIAKMEADAKLRQDRMSGQDLEDKLNADRQAADLTSFLQHLDAKASAERAYLDGRREMIDTANMFNREANRTEMSYMAEGYRTVYNGLSETLTGIVMGTKNAAEGMKALGLSIIEMFVKWQIQRRLAAMFEKQIQVSQTAAQIASATVAGTAVAQAWAPAAAMVSAATFGANAAAGMAGLAAITGFSRVMAVPGFASGGIVTKPTLAMVGEGGESEAIIPLSKLDRMSGANVTVNVHNNTGVQAQTRQTVTRSGQEMIIDLWLDAYARDTGGLRSAIKGA